jgi:hypothetical protein
MEVGVVWKKTCLSTSVVLLTGISCNVTDAIQWEILTISQWQV